MVTIDIRKSVPNQYLKKKITRSGFMVTTLFVVGADPRLVFKEEKN